MITTSRDFKQVAQGSDGRAEVVGDMVEAHPIKAAGGQRGGDGDVVGTANSPLAKGRIDADEFIAGGQDGD